MVAATGWQDIGSNERQMQAKKIIAAIFVTLNYRN